MEIFRLKKDQKVIETLNKIFEQKGRCGAFWGIGALSSVILKIYDLQTKEYSSRQFDGKYEICNMTGIVARLDDKFTIHPHVSVSDKSYNVIGGHLEEAIVGATLEIIFLEGEEIEREFSKEIGLNLLKK